MPMNIVALVVAVALGLMWLSRKNSNRTKRGGQ
jgi:hypothetical protein